MLSSRPAAGDYHGDSVLLGKGKVASLGSSWGRAPRTSTGAHELRWPETPSGVDSRAGKRRPGSGSSRAEPGVLPSPSAHKRPTSRKFTPCSQGLLPGIASHRCVTKKQRRRSQRHRGGWCCCCSWFGTPLALLLPGLHDPVGLHFCIPCLSNLADASLRG